MKTTYQTLENGQRIRIAPARPWRGKSERRRVLKQRRVEREALRAQAGAQGKTTKWLLDQTK